MLDSPHHKERARDKLDDPSATCRELPVRCESLTDGSDIEFKGPVIDRFFLYGLFF